MSKCNACGSTDIHEKPLFPRETMADTHCECLDCGAEWDEYVSIHIDSCNEDSDEES